MTPDETRQAILQLSFVAAFNGDVREVLATVFIEISEQGRLTKNSTVFTEGDKDSNTGVIILDGEVTVKKTGSPDFGCPGPELLGEAQQFNPNAKRTATIEAATDTNALRFKWSDFEVAVKRYLSEADCQTVRQGLENYAWQHFAG